LVEKFSLITGLLVLVIIKGFPWIIGWKILLLIQFFGFFLILFKGLLVLLVILGIPLFKGGY